MKFKLILCLFFFTTFAFSQKEANIWYFGNHAGLDFNSGSPVALTNGQIDTQEGCAVLSNSAGQLLFYTDGITAYNRLHQVMLNGNDLAGHSSSAQSATIVPKPGSSTLFYVFTTDNEHDPNGFRYSVIDLSLDGGYGAITADKNILVYTPTIENIAITKHANGTDFWVITHAWDNNSFNTYLLTASGLSTVPVTTNIGNPVTGVGFTAAGITKISPSGAKLAFSSVSDFVQLFDFNNNTGVISNEQTLISEYGELYGLEFSPSEKVLYVTNAFGKIYQYDLTASDIPSSKQIIYSGSLNTAALQIGPDGKIYVAIYNQFKLGVINTPDIVGLGCDFQIDGVDLGGKNSRGGLPSFNQSFFFAPSILSENVCVGDNMSFELNTNQNITSATWNFGDGNTSNNINTTHTYTTAGTYTVSVTATSSLGTGINTKDIIIYPLPVINSPTVTLKQCDDDLDGFSSFNLDESIPLLVSNPTDLSFSYYETAVDAQNNTNAIANISNYINQVVSSDAIFVRVENNNQCFITAQVNLIVSTTLIPSTFQKIFTQCDDTASGSNTDGVATFNFSSVTSQIQALYPSGQLLDITYYKNLADALAENNAITNIANYSNVGYPNTQDIYVRVDSQLNNECLGLGHHITLKVERIPIVQPIIINHCDDNQDGIFAFDTTTLQNTLLNGLTNVSVSYTDQNNNPLSSPLPNPFATTSQIINVKVGNNTTAACFYNSTIEFVVDDLPEVFTIPTNLTSVCDDETNPALQNGMLPFATTSFESALVGSQTGMVVRYYNENNNPLPSPLPDPFVSSTQNIRVEVSNPNNLNCIATGTIPLIVNAIPQINLTGNELVCSDNPNFTKVINAGLTDVSTINDYTYTWYLNNVLIASANQYSLSINTEGVYTVDVQNAQGCISTRTITVTTSNIAMIDNIEISDLQDENSIVILVSGLGDYEYSLDNGLYQDSNSFSDLDAGIYTVHIKDKNGCGVATKTISVLGIPKYFTPNGDGYNDYWNIKGISQRSGSKTMISIFDRYGKLLKEFTPIQGWDGTYNGIELPSTDYWYSIQLEDGRNVKGHFALKR